MRDKEIIVRKDHQCAYCDVTIKKGEKARNIRKRIPRTDIEDRQVGIEYYEIWVHVMVNENGYCAGTDPSVKEWFDCPECNKPTMKETYYSSLPGGGVVADYECENCGHINHFSA